MCIDRLCALIFNISYFNLELVMISMIQLHYQTSIHRTIIGTVIINVVYLLVYDCVYYSR